MVEGEYSDIADFTFQLAIALVKPEIIGLRHSEKGK
jgi:hypothetical protein